MTNSQRSRDSETGRTEVTFLIGVIPVARSEIRVAVFPASGRRSFPAAARTTLNIYPFRVRSTVHPVPQLFASRQAADLKMGLILRNMTL